MSEPSETARRESILAVPPGSGAMWLVMQAFYSTRRLLDDALRPHGVTAAQHGVLNRLAEQPGMSGADLARSLLTTPQAVHLMLGSLERDGLLTRERDPGHGRLIRSFLTESGKRRVEAGRPELRRVEAQLLAGFEGAEREQLNELLRRYISNASTAT